MRGRPRIHGITTEFGKRVWPWLQAHGLNHVPTLSRLTGVSGPTIRRALYETGYPTRRLLVGLRRLGVPVELLIPDPTPSGKRPAAPAGHGTTDEEWELLRLLRTLRPESRRCLLALAEHLSRMPSRNPPERK